jgi:hypothetical protein
MEIDQGDAGGHRAAEDYAAHLEFCHEDEHRGEAGKFTNLFMTVVWVFFL